MHRHCILSKLLLLGCMCLIISGKGIAAVPLDSIAAIVNDQVITVSMLKQDLPSIKNQLQQRNINTPADNVLLHQVLQMMINQSLIKQFAQKLNITTSPTDVHRALNRIATQRNLTITQLYQSLSKQGISKNAFITYLKQEIISEKLMQTVIDTPIKVSAQEIDNAIRMLQWHSGARNQFHLLHILIPLQDPPTLTQVTTAAKKAQRIRKQLQQGENFKTLAATQSNRSEKLKGGDMGWKTLAELPTIFANRVLTMKKGDVAGPIRTTNGFHIIKLLEARGKPLKMNITQLRTRVRNEIFQQKLLEKQQALLQQLHATAYIKILYHP